MSTLAYAQLTNKRNAAQPGTSETTGQPGMHRYLDAVAALVPAEVLTLHAFVITLTTSITNSATTISAPATTVPVQTTTITAPETLYWAFWGLICISVVLYCVPRVLNNKLDRWDWLRIFIPPLAFTAWTMVQRMTAFDVMCPSVAAAPRTVVGVFLAVMLGVAATVLAYKADQTAP
jgi:hypothetical protein